MRARSDRIFGIALRKLNILLERAGKVDMMITLNNQFKKVMSRSPVAADIRMDLCNIFLNQRISVTLITTLSQKIHKVMQEHSQLFVSSPQNG